MHQPNSDTFCISPWSEIRINSDGRYNFCHVGKKQGLPGDNIFRLTPDQYFREQGTAAQHARDTMWSGGSLAHCTDCYKNEAQGLVSFRNRRNLQAGVFPGQDFDQSFQESAFTSSLSDLTQKPRFYHVSFSNLCNLGCVMCDPFNSSYLAAEFKKINLLDANQPVLNDWTRGPAWQSFCDHVLQNDQIKSLHIMGGEPLYHKKFYELVDLLIQQAHTDYAFTFVTNGTIYDAALAEKLRKFTSVQVEISLESVDISNDYIRYPSEISTVLQNVQAWHQHTAENFTVVIRTVPQLFSVLTYHQLLDWCANMNITVDSNVLESPEFFHPALLPDQVKAQVLQNLSPFLSSHNSRSVQHINVRNTSQITQCLANNAHIVRQLLQVPQTDQQHKLTQLAQYCMKLHASRSMNPANYLHPELMQLLTQHGYDI